MFSKFFGTFSFGFWVFILACIGSVVYKLVKAIKARNSAHVKWYVLILILQILIITGLYFLEK